MVEVVEGCVTCRLHAEGRPQPPLAPAQGPTRILQQQSSHVGKPLQEPGVHVTQDGGCGGPLRTGTHSHLGATNTQLLSLFGIVP